MAAGCCVWVDGSPGNHSPSSQAVASGDAVQVELRCDVDGGVPTQVPRAPYTLLVSRTEVTVREYSRYCQARAKPMPEQPARSEANWPVVNVGWIDAADYCRFVGGRLLLA